MHSCYTALISLIAVKVAEIKVVYTNCLVKVEVSMWNSALQTTKLTVLWVNLKDPAADISKLCKHYCWKLVKWLCLLLTFLLWRLKSVHFKLFDLHDVWWWLDSFTGTTRKCWSVSIRHFLSFFLFFIFFFLTVALSVCHNITSILRVALFKFVVHRLRHALYKRQRFR